MNWPTAFACVGIIWAFAAMVWGYGLGDNKNMKTPVIYVTRCVGRNPVAQVAARSALESAVTDQKIGVYMLTHGETCADLLAGIIGTMQIVLRACDIDSLAGPNVNILRGGLNACFQVTLPDAWDKDQTTAVISGLDMALALARRVRPASISKAIQEMK